MHVTVLFRQAFPYNFLRGSGLIIWLKCEKEGIQEKKSNFINWFKFFKQYAQRQIMLNWRCSSVCNYQFIFSCCHKIVKLYTNVEYDWEHSTLIYVIELLSKAAPKSICSNSFVEPDQLFRKFISNSDKNSEVEWI